MGDDKVAPMDVDNENDTVIKAYYDWSGPCGKEYGIDAVCGSTPLGMFARIPGNHSRRLPEFSVSGKSLRMALCRLPSGKGPSTLF